MLRVLIFAFIVGVLGCQSIAKQNIDVIHDRMGKLRPLSSYGSTWCQLEVNLTEPAKARYRQMFPEDHGVEEIENWQFTWKARESSCEVIALGSGNGPQNYRGFLETALCKLAQVHLVNSPFDELSIQLDQVKRVNDKIFVAGVGSGESEYGMYLNPAEAPARTGFEVETRTKAHGILRARYFSVDGQWLPGSMEQRLNPTLLLIDEIKYGRELVADRRMMESFWISIGTEAPLRHSQVWLKECKAY